MASIWPESWRATLNKKQQQWIDQTLFTRSRLRSSPFITILASVGWRPEENDVLPASKACLRKCWELAGNSQQASAAVDWSDAVHQEQHGEHNSSPTCLRNTRLTSVQCGTRQPLLCYSGHLQHILTLSSQRVLSQDQVKDYTKPRELLGVEYLYSQTGRVLQDVSADPDVLEEAAAVQQLDEGFQEEDVDAVTPMSAPSSSSAAPLSGEPADTPRSGPSSPTAPEDGSSPEAPDRHDSPHPDHSSSDSEREMQGPDTMPGYQHVCRLARALEPSVVVGPQGRLSGGAVAGAAKLRQAALDLPCPTRGRGWIGGGSRHRRGRSPRLSPMLSSQTELEPC
ncbi:uncharacterized protein LOC129835659 [Salvelinus fontinalis]|uniref:uncharacterized protein LOC129835659 n=1 Tax=Salvelinus fontinalis TaxID=8038 RepID=UPI002485FC77|nr:uncharacterized protein LOC129835659 [Salvelinus fontinalis]